MPRKWNPSNLEQQSLKVSEGANRLTEPLSSYATSSLSQYNPSDEMRRFYRAEFPTLLESAAESLEGSLDEKRFSHNFESSFASSGHMREHSFSYD